MFLVIDTNDNDFYNAVGRIMPRLKDSLTSNIHGYKDYVKSGVRLGEEEIKKNLKELIKSEKFKELIATMIAVENVADYLEFEVPRVSQGIHQYEYSVKRLNDFNLLKEEELSKRITHLKKYLLKNIQLEYADDTTKYEEDNSEIFILNLIEGNWWCL